MALTDMAIRNAKPKGKPYKVTDSQGLYLLVNPQGSKLWRLKYRINGVERKLALGAYPDIKLAEARAARDTARKQVGQAVDPNAAKRQARIEASIRAGNTFGLVAGELIEKKAREGRTDTTLDTQRWLLKLLGKLETAKRLRAFAGQVFRYAAATARAERDPAQLLRGALVSPAVKHFAAITDPIEFGALLRAIDDYRGDPSVLYALRITPHVFQRPGEIRQMEWAEIDYEKAVWMIPAIKMKMREPHTVPLSRQAVTILREMHSLSGSGRYVFPSVRTKIRPISDNTVNAALRRLGYSKEQMTAHGFRTSASSLLNESGKWNPDAIERALAHMVPGLIRRIYNQSAYWAERVEMAQWWSDYLDQLRQAGNR